MKPRFISAAVLLSLSITVHAATFSTGRPHSTDNDDTCDIALLPAATLLVPWFEVDLTSRFGESTLMTITNVSNQEQVARVTLWTDRGYPVITFNVYLTGYDVQGINLYDVIGLGQIAPSRGTGFEDVGSPEGDFSEDNAAVDEVTCVNLPMQLEPAVQQRMQRAFTLGTLPSTEQNAACSAIGGVHTNAVGYATIDVVRSCTATQPHESRYFTQEILFDNVLTGDYQQLNGSQNFAQGSPMVHIRAIPELASGQANPPEPSPEQLVANLPVTFYGRFQSTASPTRDGRQPLPALFAARWIDGGPGEFRTDLKIWRDVVTGPAAGCEAYARNGAMGVVEVVRFDEEENLNVLGEPICCILPYDTTLPAASRVRIADENVFPQKIAREVGGWVYLNLNDPQRREAAQAWVVSSMRAEGRYSVEADVVALGNGCTPALLEQSEANFDRSYPIGPAPDVNP
jgi:hypothetical protein